jgi:Cu/Ag efflux protein CusF
MPRIDKEDDQMKKSLASLVMALLLALGASAGAEEIQGKIRQVDATERTFTLEDGTKVWVAEGLSMDQLKEGATVKASYEERDGNKIATAVEVSE